MGIFLTVYYAVMTAVPLIAGALCERQDRAQDALMLGMVMFALGILAALVFRSFKSTGEPVKQEKGRILCCRK